MTAKKRSSPATWADADDAPALTTEFFKSADLYEGKQLKARGRPKAATTKEPVKLRLDELQKGSGLASKHSPLG
jgi:uncharacterized protein (DUF4415 family)